MEGRAFGIVTRTLYPEPHARGRTLGSWSKRWPSELSITTMRRVHPAASYVCNDVQKRS